jgi:hypothetical protein
MHSYLLVDLVNMTPFCNTFSCTQIHAGHETVGIDLMATTERILLLDSEPIMSSSVLFQQLVKERFVLSDVRLDNSVEIQSLQVAAFILSVCHVVVVVMDSVDKLLFRYYAIVLCDCMV